MFNSNASPSIFAESMIGEKVSLIQRDFISMMGADKPEELCASFDRLCIAYDDTTPKSVMDDVRRERITKYQNPFIRLELRLVSEFVMSCFGAYEPHRDFRSYGSSLDFSGLENVFLATVYSSSLTGFVFEMKSGDLEKNHIVCLSEHCKQTALICRFVHSKIRSLFSKEELSQPPKQIDLERPGAIEIVTKIEFETISSFFCSANTDDVGHHFFAKNDDRKLGETLLSFLLAHEYSHICLGHRGRLNESSRFYPSPTRLNRLADASKLLSKISNVQMPITQAGIQNYFGYQEQELEADRFAFSVIYSGLSSMENVTDELRGFFQQVLYSFFWADICEVIGRTFWHRREWVNEPLHRQELHEVSDITWRTRYPSPSTRIKNIYAWAKILICDEHFQLFERELRELEWVFGFWRSIMIDGVVYYLDNNPKVEEMQGSFIWKGYPESVRGSVGYNDPTEAFRLYRWQDYAHV